MGLDITAYRQVVLAKDVELGEDGHPADYDSHMKVRLNPHYLQRGVDMVDGGIYTLGTEKMSFRAGSYSGYNGWRRTLAQMAGYPAAEYTIYGRTSMEYDAGAWAADSGPFWEIITFSDCEGVIGTSVSAKLAKDFAEYDEQAKEIGDYFYDRYQEWRKAFEMAADGGLVDFH